VVVSNIFFHPETLGKMIQLDEHIFQMGWFNHQPDLLFEITKKKRVSSRWMINQSGLEKTKVLNWKSTENISAHPSVKIRGFGFFVFWCFFCRW